MENCGHGYFANKHITIKAMEHKRSCILSFLVAASLITRTLTSPVAKRHRAAFDEIARVNGQYGKKSYTF